MGGTKDELQLELMGVVPMVMLGLGLRVLVFLLVGLYLNPSFIQLIKIMIIQAYELRIERNVQADVYLSILLLKYLVL